METTLWCFLAEIIFSREDQAHVISI